MSDCIFCKIIAGEIPASKVYEDEQVLAFLDISQVTPGHTLVVPKEHYRNLLEMDATSASQLFAQVPKVAQKVMKATKAAGMNIIANCEEVAGHSFVFGLNAAFSSSSVASGDTNVAVIPIFAIVTAMRLKVPP